MTDNGHLAALHIRLSHERLRLVAAETKAEREIRAVWVAGIEREIAAELAHLGMDGGAAHDMTDDELLAALDA